MKLLLQNDKPHRILTNFMINEKNLNIFGSLHYSNIFFVFFKRNRHILSIIQLNKLTKDISILIEVWFKNSC
jgi:hypothetical protein